MITASFSGWPGGMDNLHTDNELGADTLRRAVNVDVLDSGKVRRRKGFSPFLAEPGAHSLWSGRSGAFFVSGQTLWRLFANGTKQAIATLAPNSGPLCYLDVNGRVYFSSAASRGRIDDGLTVVPWGIEVPASPPLMVSGPGALDAGTYHAVITYVLADGRESGASLSSSLALAAPADIGFYGLPVPSDPAVVAKRIYLTTANGEAFFRVAEVAAAATLSTRGSFGAELRTRYLTPPPYGSDMDYCLGRVWIASGSTVFGTEALDFDHIDLRKQFYQFPAEVSLIAATSSGLYVCADQTYWINAPGTPEASMRPVFGFGAVPRSRATLPSTTDPIWFSERGAVIGGEGGQATIVAEKRIAPGTMTGAASLVRESDSLRQFVVVGNNAQASSLQCGSYAEAEIIRRSTP